MIKTAEARPISQILDIENTVKYFIPKYQREYVWTRSNWDYFLNDIEEANEGHFLGSIIGIAKEDSAYEKNTIELVDGQQRMTTITLFLAAILRTFQDRHSEVELDKTQTEQEKGIEKDFERWKKMLNFLSSDYKNRERFIRQYYNAFKVLDSVYVEKIPKATKSTIIKIYDKLITNDPISFFDDIYDTAKIYSENLLFDEMEDLDDTVRKKLKDLSNINGVDGHMLLMFVNKYFEISTDDKKLLINFLCKYFVRRSVTDFPPTRDLTKVFMDLIEKLYSNQVYNLQLIKDYLQEDTRCSTKDKFEASLNGDIDNRTEELVEKALVIFKLPLDK